MTEEIQENGFFVITVRALKKGRRAKLMFLFPELRFQDISDCPVVFFHDQTDLIDIKYSF